MAKRNPKPDDLTYEQAIERLEALIERIESGEIGLEESLKQYESGMALIRRCRAILGAAEQKIAELTVGEGGELASPDEPDLDAGTRLDDQDGGDVPI